MEFSGIVMEFHKNSTEFNGIPCRLKLQHPLNRNRFPQIITNCSEVELKLIQAEIDLIDSLVDKGCNELNWNSESILFFLHIIYLDKSHSI